MTAVEGNTVERVNELHKRQHTVSVQPSEGLDPSANKSFQIKSINHKRLLQRQFKANESNITTKRYTLGERESHKYHAAL